MPLKRVEDESEKLQLVCVNGQHATGRPSTMVDSGDSYFLAACDPPATPGGPAVQRTVGAVLRLFHCSECGYTEMYQAPILKPEVWKPSVKDDGPWSPAKNPLPGAKP